MTDKSIELASIFASIAAIIIAFLFTFRKLDQMTDEALGDAIINEAEADAMVELHEAAHPHDGLEYDITRPVSLPEPWDVVPSECRASCYRDDEITHD